MSSLVNANDSVRINKAINLIENSILLPNLDLITISTSIEYDIQTFNLTGNPPISASNSKEIANWILLTNGLSIHVLINYLIKNTEVLEMLCGAILLKHGHNYNFIDGFMYYLQLIDLKYCVSNELIDLKVLIITFTHVLYETHISKGGLKNPDIISQFQLLVDYKLFGDILYYIIKHDYKLQNVLYSNITNITNNINTIENDDGTIKDMNTTFLNELMSHIKISLTNIETQPQDDLNINNINNNSSTNSTNSKKKYSLPNINQLMEIHVLVSTHLNKHQHGHGQLQLHSKTYKYSLFHELSNNLYKSWNIGLFHSGDNRQTYYVICTPVALYFHWLAI